MKQDELKDNSHLIIRIEQLYPFPANQIEGILKKHPTAKASWVQEEPLNMGAATFIKNNWLWHDLKIISRPASAATAVGFKKVHDDQLKHLLNEAFI